jgi:Tol biopolymer transport system component
MGIENLTGHTLGQYQLRALMGTGGMGTVYRAYQASLKREIAIKVMSPMLASQPNYMERFNREAQTAAALEHPHIVPIHDYGSHNGISYVVMRLLTGGSLAQRMEEASDGGRALPSLAEIADLLKSLASALDYAHERGVIHRDIKPNNVMFDDRGSAYLVDFGIAKLVESTPSGGMTLTGPGIVVGTPAYIPPEQWLGKEVSPAADQYGLGIMIYSMVVGRLPFESPTLYGLINLHLHEAPTPPQTLRADVPYNVTAVLDRALAKRPEDRYPTVTAFADAFDEAVSGLGDHQTGFFTTPPGMLALTESGMFRMPPTTRAAKPIYKNPIVWILGLVILVLAGVIALMLLPDNPREAALQQTEVALISTQTAVAEIGGVVPVLAPADITATVTACEVNVMPRYPVAAERQVSFSSDRDGNFDIYLMNASGSGAHRLTDTPADDYDPVWSPDGSRAAFTSERNGNKEIYLVEGDSGEDFRLTNDDAEDIAPAWSPDGTRIAFQSRRDGNWNIYVVDVDGENLQRLTDHSGNDETPAWSSDGSQLAFVTDRDGNQEIYVMDADGGSVQRITDDAANSTNPVWSPVGSEMVFINVMEDQNWEIFSAAADGSKVRNLTNEHFDDWNPDWSPDGSLITFMSERDGNQEIYVMDADGGNSRNLSRSSADDWYPDWSPDGSRIAFESDRDGNWEIYVTDLCGLRITRLTNNNALDTVAIWR